MVTFQGYVIQSLTQDFKNTNKSNAFTENNKYNAYILFKLNQSTDPIGNCSQEESKRHLSKWCHFHTFVHQWVDDKSKEGHQHDNQKRID